MKDDDLENLNGEAGDYIPPSVLLAAFQRLRRAGVFILIITPEKIGICKAKDYDPFRLQAPKSFGEFIVEEYESVFGLYEKAERARKAVADVFKNMQ